jgi:glutamate-5-semialdehyde dehydrogenase
MSDLADYALQIAHKARTASRALVSVTAAQKNAWLNRCADLLLARAGEVIDANRRDLELAPGYGLNAAAIDRLRLDEPRLQQIAVALRDVVALPDPVGELIDRTTRPNGLLVTRVRVPLGVVFLI